MQTACAYVAPPATASETAERAALLASLGKGVPLPDNEAGGGRPRFLTGRLTTREIWDAIALPSDEQIALVKKIKIQGKDVILPDGQAVDEKAPDTRRTDREERRTERRQTRPKR